MFQASVSPTFSKWSLCFDGFCISNKHHVSWFFSSKKKRHASDSCFYIFNPSKQTPEKDSATTAYTCNLPQENTQPSPKKNARDLVLPFQPKKKRKQTKYKPGHLPNIYQVLQAPSVQWQWKKKKRGLTSCVGLRNCHQGCSCKKKAAETITKFQSLHQSYKVRVGIDYGKLFAKSRAQVMEGTFVRCKHKMEFLVMREQTYNWRSALWYGKFVPAKKRICCQIFQWLWMQMRNRWMQLYLKMAERLYLQRKEREKWLTSCVWSRNYHRDGKFQEESCWNVY